MPKDKRIKDMKGKQDKPKAKKMTDKKKKERKEYHFIPEVDGNIVADTISQDKDCMVLLSSHSCTLFAKKVTPLIHVVIDAVFQPIEKDEERTYCVLVIFEYNKAFGRLWKDEVTQKCEPFKALGAKVYEIVRHSVIPGVLDSIK